MLKLTLKVTSAFFIFGFPIAYVLYRFRGEPKEVIQHSLGIVPILLVLAVVLVLLYFISNMIKSRVINDKSGRVALALSGVLLLMMMLLAFVSLQWVISTATTTFEDFIAQMKLYRETVLVIGGSSLLGLFILSVTLGLEK